MKYWNSALNAPGSRTLIATVVHIAAAAAAVIGWKRWGKKGQAKLRFSTNFAGKLSFVP
jgi:hypothetical protein